MRTDDTMPRDDEVDADLRAAYRRIATETAPSHLDKAVLAAAESRKAPAGKGLWQWRRPLAWVTMIGLSFAIVLEFNRTSSDLAPELGDTLPQTAPAILQDDEPAAVAADAAPGANAVSSFAPQTVKSESFDDARHAARQAIEESAASQVLEEAVATQSEVGKRSRDEELEAMSAPAAAELRESEAVVMEPAAPVSAVSPVSAAAREAGALGKAASASAERLRADADREADLYVRHGADEEPACDETTRAEPERWRNCIAELVETGRIDAARVETGLYLDAFPGEPAPVPVK